MPEFASSNGMSRGELFVTKASAAETASTTHKAFTSKETGSVTITVAVTVVSGTTPTLSVAVEGSEDGATWFLLGTVGSITTAVTSIAAFPNAQWVRTRSVVGGTLPSFTYSVLAHVC